MKRNDRLNGLKAINFPEPEPCKPAGVCYIVASLKCARRKIVSSKNADKIYKRKFENFTSRQLTSLMRRCKQRKYAMKERWFEVEEDSEGKFSGYLFYKL
jgi:hypothetical protein